MMKSKVFKGRTIDAASRNVRDEIGHRERTDRQIDRPLERLHDHYNLCLTWSPYCYSMKDVEGIGEAKTRSLMVVSVHDDRYEWTFYFL